MPAEYYIDTVRVVFKEHLLPRGLWEINGERVDPSKISGTAMLTIEGELDDISGQGQTRAAHKLCTGIADGDRQHITVERSEQHTSELQSLMRQSYAVFCLKKKKQHRHKTKT